MNEDFTEATIFSFIAIFLFTGIITKACIKISIKLLKDAGCTRINYRGKEVIFGVGVVFVPVLLSMSALSLYLFKGSYTVYASYLFGVSAIGFAGVIDDLIGVKNIKGLKNHIKSFLQGQLTTGFIKAFIGIFAAFIISLSISKNVIDFLLSAFIMALFTNTLNLMDLRPGRCIKFFLLTGIIVFTLNLSRIIDILPLGLMLTIALIYLNYDLKEHCMIGDTGSNILGITLGYYIALYNDTLSKLIIFLIILSINLLSERVSLTSIISNNKLLNFLDGLGRSGR